jgi:ubiquitin-conjugating enzyme E2 N
MPMLRGWLTLCRNRVPGISAVPHEDNLRYFDVEIHGPSSSPYEGSLKMPGA